MKSVCNTHTVYVLKYDTGSNINIYKVHVTKHHVTTYYYTIHSVYDTPYNRTSMSTYLGVLC